jgi:hypothetical protein
MSDEGKRPPKSPPKPATGPKPMNERRQDSSDRPQRPIVGVPIEKGSGVPPTKPVVRTPSPNERMPPPKPPAKKS